MRSTPLAPAAALLLAGATALSAQPPASGDGVVFFDGPGRVEIARARREAPRSALGVYLGRADADGLQVTRVTPDGPAARAGIAAGDRLLAVDGTSLRVDRAESDDPLLAAVPARRLERAVGRLDPGREVELRVARDGRERTVRARTVAPEELADRAPTVRTFRRGPDGFSWGVPDADVLRERLRERFDDRRDGRYDGRYDDRPDRRFRSERSDSTLTELRRRTRARADSARARAAARPVLGVTLESSRGGRDTLGLFVAAVAAGGPAERAGVVEGDRIAQLNGVDLRVPREEQGESRAADARRARFTRELERLRPGDRATLRVWGDGRWRTVTATVGRAADVYPRRETFRFDVGDGDLLPTGPGDFEMMREFRMAPMPNAVGPRLRGFVGPDVRVAPLPPLPPLPVIGHPGRRVVRI